MSARLLFPQGSQINDWLKPPLMPAYAEETIACLGEFSRLLLNLSEIKRYPDVAALAYWLRAANLKKIAEQKLADKSLLLRPVGNVLHIAPANIDTLFFYSGALSLLTGNRNLIRLSRRRGESQALILDALHRLYQNNRWRPILERLYLFESEHDDLVLKDVCQTIDLRIIWGGDATIANIRKIPIPAYCRELTFPDKFSLALLGSAELVQASDAELNSLIQKFVNDSYSFNQQACSSPKAVIWLGSLQDSENARRRFWPALEKFLLMHDYPRSQSEQMSALINAQIIGCQINITRIHTDGFWFCRALISNLEPDFEQCHHGNAMFYELMIERIEQLTPQLKRQHQTLIYWGISGKMINNWLCTNLPKGIDRTVVIGNALDFNFIWDGVDISNNLVKKTVMIEAK